MRIKLLSLLIPIVLVLLLSGARNVKAQSPSRTSTPTLQGREPSPKTHGQIDHGQPPQIPESRFETTLLETLRTIEHDQQTARAQEQADNRRWWPPSPSWAAVYVTVVYVIVAIFQWSGIRRQADIADRSLKMAQRAAISILDVRFDQHWKTTWDVKNTGKLPATEIGGGVLGQPSQRDREPPRPTRESHQFTTSPFGDVIAPDEVRSRDFHLVRSPQSPLALISAEQQREIMAGESNFVFAIVVTYNDGFDENRTTWRWFRYDHEAQRFLPHGARQD